MLILVWAIIIIYGVLSCFIFLYSLTQLTLTLNYRKANKNKGAQPLKKLDKFPMVTIQLPIFNEQYVSERLIDATAKIDYPKDKLEIQVLDDSTDEQDWRFVKVIMSLFSMLTLYHRRVF